MGIRTSLIDDSLCAAGKFPNEGNISVPWHLLIRIFDCQGLGIGGAAKFGALGGFSLGTFIWHAYE